jgi:hypothetical protein
MTEPSDLTRLAAEVLARAQDGRKPPSASRDERGVALVAAAIRGRRRTLRLRWAATGVAAAAAAAMVLGATWGRVRRPPAPEIAQGPAVAEHAAATAGGVVEAVVGDAYVIQGDHGRSIVEGTRVAAGDRIVVQRGGHVAFMLSTGTRIGLDEGADLAVVAQGAMQLFRLGAGSMRADVHKLGTGERFLVRTPDGEVEVRGTSFRLADVAADPACGAGTTTRLAVYEGVVAVRVGTTEVNVAAGGSWPPGCGGASAGLPPPLRPAASSRPALADQNDAYSEALAARDRGDVDGAAAKFERLASKYPSSPLAENAMAERMKLLTAARSPRAADAARDYLARYPHGFARAEADAILAPASGDR